MSDVPHPAVPPLSELQLKRGHRITENLRDLRAEVSAWASEVTAASPLLVESQRLSSNVLTQLEGAQTDLGALTQVIAEAAAEEGGT